MRVGLGCMGDVASLASRGPHYATERPYLTTEASTCFAYCLIIVNNLPNQAIRISANSGKSGIKPIRSIPPRISKGGWCDHLTSRK